MTVVFSPPIKNMMENDVQPSDRAVSLRTAPAVAPRTTVPNVNTLRSLGSSGLLPFQGHSLNSNRSLRGGSVEQRNASLLRQKQNDFETTYLLQERDLVNSLDDVSLVNEAKNTANETFDNFSTITGRNLRRYGLTPNAAEQQSLDRNRNLARALNFDSTVNNARLDQEERNTTLRNNLINIGRGIETNAAETLSNAADRENDRRNAYETAKTNASAARKSTAASIGALALAFLRI